MASLKSINAWLMVSCAAARTQSTLAWSSAQWTKGRTAIVTGGSGTIGKAIATILAENGMRTVITGRSEARLQAAAEQISQSAGSESVVGIFVGDVVDEQSAKDLFAEAGRCDLLVNCAGIAANKPSVDLTAAEFSKVMDVNVLGPFLCSREAFKCMQQQEAPKGGRIINVASISAMSPRPDSAAYATSKAALLGLTQSFALDGREHGIAVGVKTHNTHVITRK